MNRCPDTGKPILKSPGTGSVGLNVQSLLVISLYAITQFSKERLPFCKENWNICQEEIMGSSNTNGVNNKLPNSKLLNIT